MNPWWAAAICAAVFVGAIAMAVHEEHECQARGGHIVQVKTGRQIMNCYRYSKYQTTCYPQDETESRCLGPDGAPR